MRWFILQDNLDKCHLSDFHALAKIKTQSTGDSDADDDNVANAATFLKYARNLFATWFRGGLTGLAWPGQLQQLLQRVLLGFFFFAHQFAVFFMAGWDVGVWWCGVSWWGLLLARRVFVAYFLG